MVVETHCNRTASALSVLTHLLLSTLITRPLHARSSPPIFITVITLIIIHTPRRTVQPSNGLISLKASSPRTCWAADSTPWTRAAGTPNSPHHAGRYFHAPRRPERRIAGKWFNWLERRGETTSSVIADIAAEVRRWWDVD